MRCICFHRTDHQTGRRATNIAAAIGLLSLVVVSASAQVGGEPCGAGTACPEGFYCQTPPGDCDGQGICAVMPELCPLVFDPVCGCDGRTYSNACFAAAAGVSIAHGGTCADAGSCQDSGRCPPGFYCHTPDGDCDGEGRCEPMPDICLLIIDPVCGCDGRTYLNSCVAAAAGVSIASDGPCENQLCGDGTICPPGFYCATPPGDCDGQGSCEPIPDVCPLVFAPVCGCDGLTYRNACFAAAAGVSVASVGPCDKEACGVGGAVICPPGFYCATPPGDCDGEGMCLPIPDACPAVFDPVCGCDGQTYPNACEAAAAGVSVAHEGPCDKQICSGGVACPPGFYCATPPGDCDGQGSCEPIPDACPEIFDPVCGCDGMTYSNACFAAAAGVSVAHEGPCEVQTCSDGSRCPPGFYCHKEVGDCDGEGVCEPMPFACPLIFAPVCGCDGVTYTNECFAAGAGVSVAHEGPCDKQTCSDGIICPPGFYCATPPGDCDGKGSCEPIPFGCPDVVDPVCGCDGMTYGNSCEAAAAGVSVAHAGPCGVDADLNGDGVVDGIDLGILLADWSIPSGATGCGGVLPCAADLNGDGVVDGIDLGILLAQWTL